MNPAVMKTLFTFEEASDPMVEDDQYVLNSNPNITIQVCAYAGGYAVNEFDPVNVTQTDHGVYSTLKGAVGAILSI